MDVDDNLIVSEPDSSVPTDPDKHTRKSPSFFPGGAPGQIFKFENWGFSYGTDDKGHAASIILSLMILALLALVILIGAFVQREWILDALQLLGTAFTFVAGVAVGKSAANK